MPFQFEKTRIDDVVLIEPRIFPDDRGFFLEVYKSLDFKESKMKKDIAQVNHSKSQKGVLRGLHFQNPPMAQGKLVSVIAGEIFDVAVDIRKGSPTYKEWVGVHLNDQDKKMLYIPEGFAHGFYVVSDIAEVIYYCTEVYSKEHEEGILWNDPEINIQWPVSDPALSEKDIANQLLTDVENKFHY